MKREADLNQTNVVRSGTVLHLISSEGFYGAENMVVHLAREIGRRNWRAIVGVFGTSGHPWPEVASRTHAEGVEIELVPCAGKVDFSVIRFLRQKISAHRVDVVHSHNYKSNLYGYMAAKLAGVPIVSTCHTWTGEALRLAIYGALDRQVLRHFTAVVGVSSAVLDELRRSGVPNDRLLRIDNGIDMELYRDAGPTILSPRGPAGTILVGCAGRLTYQKGFDVLLRAAAEIVPQVPNVSFTVAGDGEDRIKLQKIASSLGIESNVSFLGSISNMANFYRALDIFILPSRYEGMPMALLEAMASGRPIIAARVGQVPDLIDDGTTGLLVQPNDVGQLREAILRLIRDPNLASTLADRAYARVVQSYSASAMAARYLEVYQRAIRAAGNLAARPVVIAGHEPLGERGSVKYESTR